MAQAAEESELKRLIAAEIKKPADGGTGPGERLGWDQDLIDKRRGVLKPRPRNRDA